jgi:hypothetical protein
LLQDHALVSAGTNCKEKSSSVKTKAPLMLSRIVTYVLLDFDLICLVCRNLTENIT